MKLMLWVNVNFVYEPTTSENLLNILKHIKFLELIERDVYYRTIFQQAMEKVILDL